MSASTPVSVVIARFEDIVARGLQALVAEDETLALLGSDIAHERLPAELKRLLPQVAIVNFGSLRSPAEVHELHTGNPGARLIVLANRPSPSECNQMLAFGATACLSKETQARDILNAVHLASRGLHVLPKTPRELGLDQMPGPELLTPREGDVLELLRDGRSNAEIALALHVGIETVRTHARNIYRKLGVRTRRELKALAAPAPASAGLNVPTPRPVTPRRAPARARAAPR